MTPVAPLALTVLLAGLLASAGCTMADGGGGGGSSGSGGQVGTGGSGAGGRGAGAGGDGAGAGGGRGGTGAGGVTGAGGSAPVDTCAARAGLRFCDDFETATPGGSPAAPRWSVLNGGGAVVVDASAPAHSGTRSVRVSPVDSGFQTFLVFHDPATVSPILPTATGKFFVRFYMRLAQPMTPGHNTFVVADLFAQPGAGNALRLGEMNAMLMMTVSGDAHGYLSNQNYYNDGKPGVVFMPGAWTCVELSLDPAATTIDVWVDGREVPDLHPINIQLDRYDDLRFGLEKYAGPVSDIWYDDVAIGSERIGCN